MKLPKGLIIVWPGTHAGIPSGFERATELDGLYPKGAADAAEPGDTGGDTGHSHTSPAHSHTTGAHTHSIALNASTAGGNSTGSTSSGGPSSNHGHVAVTSGAATGGGLSSVTSTYDEVASEPPYYEVIFIKALGNTAIPDDAVAFIDSADVPDGMAEISALDGKFLKGAATGQDAGTTGGSSTHTGHTITHTHVETGHTHARVQSGAYTATTDFETASGTADSVQSHTHDLDLDSNTMGVSGGASSGSGNNEPLHNKLLPVQNTSGGPLLPIGIIGMWIGSRATIPAGWEEVEDMQGYHLKCASDASGIFVTGGSNTHTHSDSHGHNGGVHTHNATVEVQAATNNLLNSGHSLPKPHGHTANVGSQSGDWDSANTSADAANNEPPYYTVIFLKLVRISSGMSQIIES